MRTIDKNRLAALDADEEKSRRRVESAKRQYLGPNGQTNLSANLPLAVDRMIAVEAPTLGTVSGHDYAEAHSEADELDGERFDPW